MNVLVVADREEVRKLRLYVELETADRTEIRFFPENTCDGALKRVAANPCLYESLFIGRNITDRSDRADAGRIQRMYSMNPRLLICMATSKNFLTYEFCSLPCICTIRSPFSREDIRSVLERMSAIEQIRYGNPAFRIPVYDSEGVRMIPAAAIRYARKVRNGLRLVTDCGTLFHRQKMDDFERAAGSMFLRCHGSYIVNLTHLLAFRGGRMEMDDGELIPVSRNYQSQVRQRLSDDPFGRMAQMERILERPPVSET